MEEVWKDITLSSLNPNPNAHFQPLTFQDFLSQPFSNRNHQPSVVASEDHDKGYPSLASPRGHDRGYPSHASPPPIALGLNSGTERFNSMCHSNQFRHNNNPFMGGNNSINMSPHCLNNVSFDELASGTGLPELGRKRFPENDNSVDRRHKRMIKNRESAARSRARRQAYTNELELEVSHLTEENARLKRQQQQLCLAAASQVPKRHSLHRSSTAPF